MRNLFILNGAIPVIVALTLMEREYSDDENIVVLEHMHSGDSQLKLSNTDYQQVTEMLASLLPAKAFAISAFPTTLTEFGTDPFVAFREARVFVEKGREIARQFPGRFDRVFYSGNARTPLGLNLEVGRWICIEHGYGEYFLSLPGRRLRFHRCLQRWIIRLFTGARERSPDELILTDGGACRSSSQRDYQGASIRRVAPPDISDIFSRFQSVAQNTHPDILSTLDALRTTAGRYEQVFLYLPQFMIPEAARRTLIDEQLKILKPNNALFIIKPHPRDVDNYVELFQEAGLEAVEIPHPLARNIPAEFILALLPNARPVACMSASLFYALWWMKRPSWCLCGQTIELPPTLQMYWDYFQRDIARQNGNPVS